MPRRSLPDETTDPNHDDDDHDQDHDEMEDTNETTTNTRRSKRLKVMSESGQTLEQRRKLRTKQRNLKHRMLDQSSELSAQMSDPTSNMLENVREENNVMFTKVRYTREAVLDGENIEMIGARAARMVDTLIAVPRYDTSRFILKLKSKCSIDDDTFDEDVGANGSFDWRTFSMEVGSCFNAVPPHVTFLNGPIDSAYQPKIRKKPVRRRKAQEEDIEDEEVDDVQQKKRSKDQDKLSAAEKQVSDVHKLLNKKVKQDEEEKLEHHEEQIGVKVEEWDTDTSKSYKRKCRPGQVDAIKFLFNPKSFTQTIENIFSYSFLVKKGDAKIGFRSEKDATKDAPAGPYVSMANRGGEKSGRPKAPRQAIISLSMRQWKEMVEVYDLKEGDLPHRGKSKYARKK